jgi:hypothetical protein
MIVAEDKKVREWHVEQMVTSGLNPDTAVCLGELGIDWHDVARLLAAGCPETLIVRILGH